MKKIGIIGGITADIEGNPYGQLVYKESNTGTVSMSYGGVGRNITENLARIGEDVIFVSAAGDDFCGRGAVRELSELGVNVDFVNLLQGENTAVYMSILNLFRDMEVALCNMDVLERISDHIIDEAVDSLKDCEIIGMDTNPTEESLDYMTKKLEGIPLFLDPVSIEKAQRAKNLIGRFHTIKPNRMEAEALTGLSILSVEELEKAGEWFIEQGVKRVFITLSGGGVYYTDGIDKGTIRPGKVNITSATGAGDAFSAAILSGFIQGLDMKTTAEYGMAAASIAMESKTAVNNQISKEFIAERCQENVENTMI